VRPVDEINRPRRIWGVCGAPALPERLTSRMPPKPQPPIHSVDWPEQGHTAVVLPPPCVRVLRGEIVEALHVVLIGFGVTSSGQSGIRADVQQEERAEHPERPLTLLRDGSTLWEQRSPTAKTTPDGAVPGPPPDIDDGPAAPVTHDAPRDERAPQHTANQAADDTDGERPGSADCFRGRCRADEQPPSNQEEQGQRPAPERKVRGLTHQGFLSHLHDRRSAAERIYASRGGGNLGVVTVPMSHSPHRSLQP